MKLSAFRITNYRSIINTTECRLSMADGITVLAGQNESGKSSILEALKHYESGTACQDAYRDEEDMSIRPLVICSYIIEDDDDIYNRISGLSDIPSDLQPLLANDEIISFINKLKEFEILRTIGNNKTTYLVALGYGKDVLNNNLSNLIKELKKTEEFKDIIELKVRNSLGQMLFRLAPKIILFDEDFDILPDKFYLDEFTDGSKAKGFQAVRNVETILGVKFSELEDFSEKKIISKHKEFERTLTADFNEKWRQRVGDEKGATITVTFHREKEGRPYLTFFIQTREGELLPPHKRSLGFKWFLSFYLHLKAEGINDSNLVLLFDEPGLHLHSKAQYDMLRVFEELGQKNQIIYATHSPYLIDTNKLNRVKLIFNSKKLGTTIEKITTKLSENQKDAIKPIIDALGMNVAHDFSAAKSKNVIVEGISDHYYLTAAKSLLDIKNDFYFMPAMGAPNIHLLMELCIGWGLQWLIIFDDKDSVKHIKKIKNQFFPNDNTVEERIHILKKCDGIEDIFTEEDIKLVEPTFTKVSTSLSSDLRNHGGKELIGRLFLSKVESGHINLEQLSKQARNHFDEIFNFIEQGFK